MSLRWVKRTTYVIYDMPALLEVGWENDCSTINNNDDGLQAIEKRIMTFVQTVELVSVEVFRLSAMPGV
jgi:hypothetical protein